MQHTFPKVQKCAFFAYQNVHSWERHPTPCFYLAQKMGRNGGDIFGNSEKRAPQGRFSTFLHPTGFPERYKGAFLVFLTNDFRPKKMLFFSFCRGNPPIRQGWRSRGRGGEGVVLRGSAGLPTPPYFGRGGLNAGGVPPTG